MSDTAARAALERMNLREAAVTPIYTTIAADLQMMATADPDKEHAKFMERRRNELCEAYGYSPREQNKPFAFADGVAIIPFHGSMINRFSGSYGYVTGYNFIDRQMAAAMSDDDVTMIVGDFNTYGGEAAGCFERSNMIYEMRGEKPMLAVVDSNCYSAGYALASAFDSITVTPTGGVGSIGVVAMHMDISAMLDKFGVKVTFIHFGDQKVEGNPYEKLSAPAKERIQKSVNQSGDKFVSLVARNRDIDAAVVKDTQAAVYRAEEALALGLIDTIAAPSQAVQVFLDELSGSKLKLEKEVIMTTETKPGATDQAQKDATEKAANDARVAERARFGGIIGCEEAKGRESLANHLATNTSMSLEDAKATLAASPKTPAVAAAPAPAAAAPAPAADKSFKAVMDASEHPNVGAGAVNGAGASGEQLTSEQQADALLADAALGGVALKPLKK